MDTLFFNTLFPHAFLPRQHSNPFQYSAQISAKVVPCRNREVPPEEQDPGMKVIGYMNGTVVR